MEVNYVFEGLKIMMLGMGTVFTFLVVMIVMMNIMSKIVHRFFPEPNDVNNTSPAMTNNAKKIAAITAAIMHHRQAK